MLECLPSAAEGWEAGARCLIERHEEMAHEGCKEQIEHLARHLPLALFAAGKHHLASDHLGSGDFGKRVNKGCNVSSDVLPYVWSYHLHIQWEPFCEECKETAMNFTDKFINEFQPDAKMCRRMAFLTDLWNTDSVSRDNPQAHHFAEICKMATLPPGGPFLHSEKGFTISTTMFHRVLPWLMANRPLNNKLYLFVHPNTGCQYNDLRHWSMWASKSVAIFYDILQGCVWASCEDKVLGCIAFNHKRKDQGYGPCFTPPTKFNIDCSMSLEGTGNTSTMSCDRSTATAVVPLRELPDPVSV